VTELQASVVFALAGSLTRDETAVLGSSHVIPDTSAVGRAKVARPGELMTLCVSEDRMNRFRRFLPLVAVLIGTVAFGSPNQAQAAYSVRVFDDGVLQGGITVVTAANSLVFFGSTTHFSITNGSGLSNNPGAQNGSNLDLSSNQQINALFGTAGGSHTIRIELSQTDWTAPTGTPLFLSSSAGGSFAYLGGTNPSATQSVSVTYQGFLDNTNALFGQPGAGSTPIQTASASRTSPGTSPLVFSPGTATNSGVPGGTPFSITDVLAFTFTLGAGSGQTTANVSASTVAAVPAPAGLVLVVAGLPFLGIGTWLRRRQQANPMPA